jgi:hypothetical protein
MPSHHSPEPDDSTRRYDKNFAAAGISPDAIQRLAEAVARLNTNDPEHFVRALTDRILAMTPVTKERLTENESRFLIEAGQFTKDQLVETTAAVDEGTLQLDMAEAWLSGIRSTLSVEDVAAFLDRSEEDVRSAVAVDHLYAIEISGQLRFPIWQLDAGSPGKVLPGLADLVPAVSSRRHWQSVAGFVATTQQELIATGPQTPTEWLRRGGNIDAVLAVIEGSEWS